MQFAGEGAHLTIKPQAAVRSASVGAKWLSTFLLIFLIQRLHHLAVCTCPEKTKQCLLLFMDLWKSFTAAPQTCGRRRIYTMNNKCINCNHAPSDWKKDADGRSMGMQWLDYSTSDSSDVY